MKANNHTHPSWRKGLLWVFHLIIFGIGQLAFYIFDGYKGWHIFSLNPSGERFVTETFPLSNLVQFYESDIVNGTTVIWGIILIIHGLVTIVTILWPSKESYTK
ncbi:hypothetical protein H8S33_00300 [Ornithinibacillus sp. BX22]|uniref:YfzA-like protein n=1 Tax=Ornithinibacillus hominis TaxID=2763055 RepID=A0A923L2G6_9BACI|nr:hypothetical protein [Ornithinibacillus hominis]MBC5635252.1 hypothetical protein [Ornithinibacillus hominis]